MSLYNPQQQQGGANNHKTMTTTNKNNAGTPSSSMMFESIVGSIDNATMELDHVAELVKTMCQTYCNLQESVAVAQAKYDSLQSEIVQLQNDKEGLLQEISEWKQQQRNKEISLNKEVLENLTNKMNQLHEEVVEEENEDFSSSDEEDYHDSREQDVEEDLDLVAETIKDDNPSSPSFVFEEFAASLEVEDEVDKKTEEEEASSHILDGHSSQSSFESTMSTTNNNMTTSQKKLASVLKKRRRKIKSQYSSPKKWRRMIRSHRLRSILLE